jgi:parallel beta-helix repeat protein
MGRMFAKGALSLQSFPRAIRATLAHSFYYDIDMVNAHPVILSHLCKSKNNSIINNICIGNLWYGIYLDESNTTTLKQNKMEQGRRAF